MYKYTFLLSISFFITINLHAQDYGGFYFGVKGGGALGFQTWNKVQKDPLLAYQAIAFMESLPKENKFSVFMQAGYHLRGTTHRSRGGVYVDNTGQERTFSATVRKYQFNNISLAFGAKQRHSLSQKTFAYYMLGIRGEYTIGNNLCRYQDLKEQGFQNNCTYDAFAEFVQKWNYGMILGGGFDFEFAEKVGLLIELSINPDISTQYKQPSNVPRLYSLNTTGNIQYYSEQLVRNTTLELSIGIRLLRKVEYID